jgi:plasmid segregation protein ParM
MIVSSDSPAHPVILAGIDDGFAYTKLALPDGRLLATPSRAHIGRCRVSWIQQTQRSIFEYQTDGVVYSVGEVDAAATRFEGYACSGLNRVIVQHALQQAELGGHRIDAVSGLPVSGYYRNTGALRREAIDDKRENLLEPVCPLSGMPAAEIVYHEIIPEALAAWYDYVISDERGEARLDQARVALPVAVVDIGGRTTDTVVVRGQAILHGSSGSIPFGLLDVEQSVADALQERFDLEMVADRMVHRALKHRRLRLYGQEHDVSHEVLAAKAELVERLYAETRRQLGRAAELDQVLFVGGGTVALADHMTDWFPNQVIADQPAFANARGMLKYLRFVSERSHAA